MFRRVFFELTRVFVPAGQESGFLPASQRECGDVPFVALDDAVPDGESGQPRLRDCAAMRAARSCRRVWRPREARRVARLC